jgi:hypothetical protein
MAVTVNIPSQNIVKTTAQWSSDSTVYSDKYVLWVSDLFYSSTDQMQFKKADGVQTFASLDFMPIGAGGGGTDSVMIEYMNTNGTALADFQDYFIAVGTGLGATINSSTPEPIPTGTVKEAYISTYNGSTFGTSESVTLSLVDESGTVLGVVSTAVKFDARNNFLKETLNISVTEGNTFIKIDVPSMVTNPASAKIIVNLKIEL